MEGLASICRDGKDRYFCFSETKTKLFASVAEGTLKSWVRLLEIKRIKPSQNEHEFFRKTIPSNALGAFHLISEHDLSRLLSHFRERRAAQSLAVGPSSSAAWPILHDTCSANADGAEQINTPTWCARGQCGPDEKESFAPGNHVEQSLSFPDDHGKPMRQIPQEPRGGKTQTEQKVNQNDKQVSGPRDSQGSESETGDSTNDSDGSEDSDDEDDAPAPQRRPAEKRSSPAPTPAKKSKATTRGGYALKLNSLNLNLQRDIAALREFYLAPFHYQRGTGALTATTIDKTVERLLCFLAFAKKQKQVVRLELSLVLDLPLVQSYVNYMGDGRSRKSSTLSAHLGSLLHVTKFLQRGRPEDTTYVLGIRSLQRQLDKSARKEKKLETAQKELSNAKGVVFPELLEICRQLRQEFEDSPSKFERARLVHDLLILLIYCTVNPGRAKEYVTLRIATEKSQVLENGDQNYILFQNDGSEVRLYEGAYKTSGHYGPIVTDLSPFEYICYYMKLYVKTYRSVLLAGKEHSFLFCNTKGDPFSRTAYHGYLSRFFERRCSTRLTTNDLRKAVVTYFLSLPESSDQALRESVAAVMKHSVRAQKRYYDQRPTSQKKARGLKFLGGKVACGFLGPSFAPSSSPEGKETEHEDEDGCITELTPTMGDLVALVAKDSTLDNPGVYVARVMRISEDRETAVLSNYEEVEPMRFKMKAGSCYRDSTNALVFPIDIVYSSDDGLYQLRTPKLEIHQQVILG